MNKENKSSKIAIIGLGYVGLPLAVEFAQRYSVVGYDINTARVAQLSLGVDKTNEVDPKRLISALSTYSTKSGLKLSSNEEDLVNSEFYIITVPTPVDAHKKPDLSFLNKASFTVGKYLKRGSTVIYESTVYPGCTEEMCIPILESVSGLKLNQDFFCGYSPERINPGDKQRPLSQIVKITSGSNELAAKKIDSLYASIIKVGTFRASSIKVAEAAKAIENAQRDINISFVNELALIFDRMGIDTQDVLDAAATKWNFLNYKPGLVGGHCIGVDPYYLAHKAQSLGYHPQVILSGRRVNDDMGMFVANKVVKLMIQKGHTIKGANALILGVTFKENCPDVRNTKVVDIQAELLQFGLKVDVYDPWADKFEVKSEYDINLLQELTNKRYEAIVVAVAHRQFLNLDFNNLKSENGVIFDTKSFINRDLVDARL